MFEIFCNKMLKIKSYCFEGQSGKHLHILPSLEREHKHSFEHTKPVKVIFPVVSDSQEIVTHSSFFEGVGFTNRLNWPHLSYDLFRSMISWRCGEKE